VKFDCLGSSNVALQRAPFHDEYSDVDVGLDVCSVTEDQDLATLDLSAEAPVDAKSPIEMQLTFEMGASSKQGGDLRDWNGCIHGRDSSSYFGTRQVLLSGTRSRR